MMRRAYSWGGLMIAASIGSSGCGAPPGAATEEPETAVEALPSGSPTSFATCATPPDNACGSYGVQRGWVVLKTDGKCPDLRSLTAGSAYYKGLVGAAVTPSGVDAPDSWIKRLHTRLTCELMTGAVDSPDFDAFVGRYAPGLNYKSQFCVYTRETTTPATMVAAHPTSEPSGRSSMSAASALGGPNAPPNPCNFGVPVEAICIPAVDFHPPHAEKQSSCMGNCGW